MNVTKSFIFYYQIQSINKNLQFESKFNNMAWLFYRRYKFTRPR